MAAEYRPPISAATQAAIDAEASTRGSADITLAAADVAEAVARAAADSAEVTARTTAISAAISGESTARIAADVTLTTAVGLKASQAALDAETSARTAADALLAPLASPALTGNPTVPTQSVGNSTTRAASTAYVQGEVALDRARLDAAGAAEMLATVGEETFSRNFAVSASALTSGTMRLAYFTARRTEAINGLVVQTDVTAAGATPSLARLGVYSVAVDGSLTLLAATANDTSLFAAAGTEYQRSLTSAFSKVAGVTYAVGVLVVSAATMPTMVGQALGLASPQPLGGTTFNRPRMAASVTGLSDLPATVAAGSVVNVRNRFPYAVMTP